MDNFRRIYYSQLAIRKEVREFKNNRNHESVCEFVSVFCLLSIAFVVVVSFFNLMTI